MSLHPKSIADLWSALKGDTTAERSKDSVFARFLGLFDLRLLQQNMPEADISFVIGSADPLS
jgi:hypothetical protein